MTGYEDVYDRGYGGTMFVQDGMIHLRLNAPGVEYVLTPEEAQLLASEAQRAADDAKRLWEQSHEGGRRD